MILIAFYGRFPLFIKIVGIITILPALIGLIYVKMETSSQTYLIWRKVSYQAVHIVSLLWGFFFYVTHKRNNLKKG
jgi:hypothetical protein